MHSSKSADSHLWFGLVIFVIGAVILLQRFDLIPETTWSYLWPIILIVSGLKFMISYGASDCCGADKCSDKGACCDEPMMKKSAPKKRMARKRKTSRKK